MKSDPVEAILWMKNSIVMNPDAWGQGDFHQDIVRFEGLLHSGKMSMVIIGQQHCALGWLDLAQEKFNLNRQAFDAVFAALTDAGKDLIRKKVKSSFLSRTYYCDPGLGCTELSPCDDCRSSFIIDCNDEICETYSDAIDWLDSAARLLKERQDEKEPTPIPTPTHLHNPRELDF